MQAGNRSDHQPRRRTHTVPIKKLAKNETSTTTTETGEPLRRQGVLEIVVLSAALLTAFLYRHPKRFSAQQKINTENFTVCNINPLLLVHSIREKMTQQIK